MRRALTLIAGWLAALVASPALAGALQDMIDAAEDGRAALQVIARQRPDAILLDLLMPRMDGFSVIDRLHGDPKLQDIPVIVLTAKTLTGDEQALLQKRVLTVIRKAGLDRETLMQELKHALPGRVPAAAQEASE